MTPILYCNQRQLPNRYIWFTGEILFNGCATVWPVGRFYKDDEHGRMIEIDEPNIDWWTVIDKWGISIEELERNERLYLDERYNYEMNL